MIRKTKRPQVRNDEEQQDTLGQWFHALIHPFFLFQGLVEVGAAAVFTRPWRRVVLFLPALAAVVATISVVLYGSLLDPASLRQRYVSRAEQELELINTQKAAADTVAGEKAEAGDAAGGLSLGQEPTSAYTDMLFRRLIRLDDDNPRTRYMVALQLVRDGRIGPARQIAREIAPAGATGFAPAHAWLAVDLLSRKQRTAEEHAELMQHLRVAASWSGVKGSVLAVYANLLAAEGKRQEALAAMEKAAQKDSKYDGTLAILARQLNAPKIADDASARAKKILKEKIESDGAAVEDYVQLIKLQLSELEFQAALDTGRSGLQQSPGDDQLKFWCSEALRLQFRQSVRQTDSGIEMDLGLLDAAIKEFPSNPLLAEEVARLTAAGNEAPPELKSLLETQLASGKATAISHILIANQEIKAGRLEESIPHLEVALVQAPTHAVTLNNLALALALTDKGKLPRAEELIDKAISINPRIAEFYNTQGEIRLIAGRPYDAIASLETAIKLAPGTPGSHLLLARAYRAVGSEDMARVHEKQAADAEAKRASDNASSSAAPPRSAEPEAHSG